MKNELLLKKIRREFPKLIWENHRFVEHGWDHSVVILDDKIVFRAPKRAAYKKKFMDEVRLLTYLKSFTDVGVPGYEYVAADGSFAGYDIMPGRELTKADYHDLSDNDKEIVTSQLAGFLTTLHAVSDDKAYQYNIERLDTLKSQKWLEKAAEKHIFHKLNPDEVNWVKELFAELRSVATQEQYHALVHSDLRDGHIFWDPLSRQVSIIDFGDACIWDTAKDFTGLFEYGEEFCERVYAMYKGPKDKDQLYRAKLYYKRIAIFLMVNSQLEDTTKFEVGYNFYLGCR